MTRCASVEPVEYGLLLTCALCAHEERRWDELFVHLFEVHAIHRDTTFAYHLITTLDGTEFFEDRFELAESGKRSPVLARAVMRCRRAADDPLREALP